MALAGGIGMTMTVVPQIPNPGAILFGEDQGRYVVTTDNSDPMLRKLAQAVVPHLFLGSVGGDALRLPGGRGVALGELRRAHEDFFPSLMRGEPAVA
jgi:phosphoribosylformylglycinamidine synthase